jgi:hypothetical protein
MAVDGGQVARASVSADTSHKPLFGKKGKVLNLGHLYFDIVSDFVLRFSYFASLGISTVVESALQIHLFLQNEPNFRKIQINLTNLLKRNYEQMDTWSIRKNEPKTNPNEPKTNPILANKTSKRTQFKPKQTQFRRKKMLPRLTIKPRYNSFGPYAGRIYAHNAQPDRLKAFFSIFDLRPCRPNSCSLSLRDRIGHVFAVLTFKLHSYKLSPLFSLRKGCFQNI